MLICDFQWVFSTCSGFGTPIVLGAFQGQRPIRLAFYPQQVGNTLCDCWFDNRPVPSVSRHPLECCCLGGARIWRRIQRIRRIGRIYRIGEREFDKALELVVIFGYEQATLNALKPTTL